MLLLKFNHYIDMQANLMYNLNKKALISTKILELYTISCKPTPYNRKCNSLYFSHTFFHLYRQLFCFCISRYVHIYYIIHIVVQGTGDINWYNQQ
jgi:hypothetical protein